MPHFLIQGSYNQHGWESIVANPRDLGETMRPLIEKLGGSVVGAYLALREMDFVLIAEMPDRISAAAVALAVSAGFGCTSVKTAALMEAAEDPPAIRKATAGPH